MKPIKKVQRKLERRQKGYQQIIEDNKHKSRFNPAGYRVPGSRNQKK